MRRKESRQVLNHISRYLCIRSEKSTGKDTSRIRYEYGKYVAVGFSEHRSPQYQFFKWNCMVACRSKCSLLSV